MSDLISRLATRVVGSAATTAVPRPVPRFGEGRGLTLEVVEETDTERAPPLVVPVIPEHADATHAGATHAGATLEGPPAGDVADHRSPRSARRGAPHPEDVSVFRGGPPDGLDDRSTTASLMTETEGEAPPPSEQPATPGRDRQRATDAAPAGTTERGPRPLHAEVTTAASPPGQPPSTPPASAWPRPTFAAPDHPRDRADGPDVTVHIGRLDVRAVPAPAVVQRHRPDPPKPGLSLADYLRGQREEP